MKLLRVRHKGNDRSYMEDVFQFVCEDSKVVVCTRVKKRIMENDPTDFHIFHRDNWDITFDVCCGIHDLVNSERDCYRGFFSKKCCCKCS